jgi:hypothetical protein
VSLDHASELDEGKKRRHGLLNDENIFFCRKPPATVGVALLPVVSAGVSTAAGSVLLNADHVHELDIARMHRVRPPPLAISTRSAE